MSTRTTGNADGTVNPTESAEAPRRIYSGDAPVSFPATIKINEPAFRAKVDTETGAIVVEDNAPTSYQAQPVSHRGAVVRNSAGVSIALAHASPSDVVDLPGIGTTSVAAAVQNNWLVPAASGNGYELPGAPQASAQAQQAPQQDDGTKPQDTPPVNPNDVKDVPPTSAASDAVLAAMTERTPAALEGAIQAISKGADPSAIFEDAGRQLQDEGFAAKAEAMRGEFITSGQAVLRNVGVSEGSFEAFEVWAQQHEPEAAADAVRDLVKHRSVAKLADLGRKFVASSNHRLAQIIQSKGVDTRIENGVVYVSRSGLGLPPTPRHGDFGGSDLMTLAEAIRQGHIEIS